MMCQAPFRKGIQEFPCGWCMPCRIKDQRIWATRNMLELTKHGDASFVTLTFDDKHVPFEISKRDTQLFLKRLRRSISPRKVRYFACGEYGEESGRPHYHALLFGVSMFDSRAIHDAWEGKGFIQIGEVNEKTINYTTGYILKGNKSKNGRDEQGRLNPFRVMSRGIGKDVILPETGIWQTGIAPLLSSGEDIPRSVRIGGSERPIGRYLSDRLRRDSVESPDAVRACAERNRLAAYYDAGRSTSERIAETERDRQQSGFAGARRLSIRNSLRKKI